LAALARRVAALKSEEPADEAEAQVARLVRDEVYRPASWLRLPVAFTGGLGVYDAHVMVRRALLPGRKLEGSEIHCRTMPGESGEVLMSELPEGMGGRRPLTGSGGHARLARSGGEEVGDRRDQFRPVVAADPSGRYAPRPKGANSGTDFNGLLCQYFGE
jgi:hypothetical protein